MGTRRRVDKVFGRRIPSATSAAPAGGSHPVRGARPVDLVIHAPRAIIDGHEQSASVLVRMRRIVGIEPYGAAPPGSPVAMQEPHEVLIPGLVDTHVNITSRVAPNGRALIRPPGRPRWRA